jgi:FkbM family methyltransferase
MKVIVADTILPNGMKVAFLKNMGGDWEVPATYRHIQEYFKNGINVARGSTVFDIGANIGLFSLFVHDVCHKHVNIYSFEPVPVIYNVLKTNFNRYSQDNLHAFPFGISNKPGKTSFFYYPNAYYPNAPGLSTFYPEHMEVGLEKMLKFLENNPGNLPGFFKKTDNPILSRDKRFNKMRAILGLKTVFQNETIQCRVKTLSQVIREENIQEIDLLKVDVNGSEGDVFDGIEQADWRMIKQVVAEVPGSEENTGTLNERLKKQGFTKIVVENQEAVIR